MNYSSLDQKGGDWGSDIDRISSPVISTKLAAYYLNRQPQTLRFWAASGTSPVSVVRINGRLAWSVASIRNLISKGN